MSTRSGALFAVFTALLIHAVSVSGNASQFGLLPLGDLTTSDQGGPYNVPQELAAVVQATIAAKRDYTDKDILDFLTNTECLESIFNTYAAFGTNIPNDLHAAVTTSKAIGGRRAALSNEVQAYAEEVALDEQGHVRFIRDVLGTRALPCPTVDISTAFADFFDRALNRTSPVTPRFDAYANDVNFLLATWLLEEIGATGDKGSINLISNPGIAGGIAGLSEGPLTKVLLIATSCGYVAMRQCNPTMCHSFSCLPPHPHCVTIGTDPPTTTRV